MPARTRGAAREAAFELIASERDAITRVCRAIHADPEPALQEQRAVARLTELLEGYGFEVERGIAGLPTAFQAVYARLDSEVMRKGARHANIGFIVEYDASPDDGHTHGHPLTCAVGVATAVALKAALEHGAWGTITVLGTPGTAVAAKHTLSRNGVFAPLDAVFGAHPAGTGQGFFHTFDSSGNTLGSARVTIAFAGSEESTERVAGVQAAFSERPPATQDHEDVSLVHADADVGEVVFEVRAGSRTRIVELLVDLKELAQQASGTTTEDEDSFRFSVTDVYDDLIVSRVLARRMKTYADNLGLRLDKPEKMPFGEPTEWGSVSYDTSTVQAWFPITTEQVQLGEARFAEVAASDEAYEQAFRVAECMAFAALDLYRELDFRAMTDNQLVKALGARGVERQHRRWTGLHPVLPKPGEEGRRRGPQRLDFKIVRGPEAGSTPDDLPPG
jgi:hypothetical protein